MNQKLTYKVISIIGILYSIVMLIVFPFNKLLYPFCFMCLIVCGMQLKNNKNYKEVKNWKFYLNISIMVITLIYIVNMYFIK